ncbi:MAG TPA: hypothetical protein DCZ75_15750 [Geobacter sp.]|nr:hypothetical protein [Geobacter sp.]
MNRNELMHNLSTLGLPMFQPSETVDVNATVAEVVKSRDTRLWELFPTLLANAAEDSRFAPQEVDRLLPDEQSKKDLHKLFLLCSSLYSLYHLTYPWCEQLKKGLPNEEKALVKRWRQHLVDNEPIAWDDREFDPQRLKRSFELYVEQNVEKSRRRKEKHEEFSLAYALSQLFSPKQIDLFKRKLEGLPMTKTEQEYYSRSVKKKVVALANSELHGMARKLLEQ